MYTQIINGRIVMPYRIAEGMTLIMNDAHIEAVVPRGEAPACGEIFDARGCFVSPGFIDIHTHGGGGYDFMDGTPEAIEGAAKSHMRHGTTAISPTTLTGTDEDLFTFFDCLRAAKRDMKDGPELLGAHLEGPYFSYGQRGAQDPKYLRMPEKAHYDKILENADIIARMSAAPELPGALELGDELRKHGILASVGHSDAEYSEMLAAYEHGYTHVTHLYSGMSTIHRKSAYRHLGVVESAYLIDGMTVEIIADGCHLPPELLRLILRSKPIDDICLVTDSMRGAGMPEGSVNLLGSLKNGQETIIKDGVAFTMDGQAFAGSVCTADRCVRTMNKKVGLPVYDAVRMMTGNPARILGLEKRIGALGPGMDADICVFDDDINVRDVFAKGRHIVHND